MNKQETKSLFSQTINPKNKNMNFPMSIADQQEFNRLVRDIAQPIADATAEAMLIRFGKISKYMKMSEAIRLAHSEKLVKDAMFTKLTLKYVMKGKNYMILRSDFNAWQQKHTF